MKKIKKSIEYDIIRLQYLTEMEGVKRDFFKYK